MTILHRPAEPAPPPVEASGQSRQRVVRISANLMPGEVIGKRRGRTMQRRVLLGLALLLVLLIAGYGFTWLQTHNANDELAAAQQKAVALAAQQQQFAPLVDAQREAAQIQQTLGQLMAGDLQWSKLLDEIRSKAVDGVSVAGVTGTVTTNNAAAAPGVSDGLGVLNQTGEAQVGTVTITGTAPSKNTVAQFVDRLGTVRGLAAAFPASVTSDTGKLTFSVNVLLTSKALGGRFTVPTGTTEGN